MDVVRLVEIVVREHHIHESEQCGDESWGGRAELCGEGAEHRPDGDAGVGGGAEPAECLGALFGLRGVGDVRLDDADGPTTGALHESR